MSRKIVTIVAVILLIVGLGLFLFPIVSNFVGKQIAQSEINTFDNCIENIQSGSYNEALKAGKVDKEGYLIDEKGNRTSSAPVMFDVDIERLRNDSIKYNEELIKNQYFTLSGDNSYEAPCLNLADYGAYNYIYGYVSAPSIGMQLPIYLGANDANMSYGAAHMTNTSLPIGGLNTNTVLAGHTGYIGRIFFDNLRHLNIGEAVFLTNYWGTIEYTVVDTKIVTPEQSEDIFITKDRDLLTMVTCIRNGNHDYDRYLVICERA